MMGGFSRQKEEGRATTDGKMVVVESLWAAKPENASGRPAQPVSRRLAIGVITVWL